MPHRRKWCDSSMTRAGMRVDNDRTSNVQYQLLERVRLMADLRRSRINYTHSGVPNVIWGRHSCSARSSSSASSICSGLPNFRVSSC